MVEMTIKRKITVWFLYAVALFSVIYGLTYVIYGNIVPYHKCFLRLYNQQDYDALMKYNDRVIPLMVGLMQILGGGMIAIGIAVFFITKNAFAIGQQWAWWCLLIMLTFTLLPIMYVTHMVAISIDVSQCTSRPPWMVFCAMFVVIVIVFIINWQPKQK
jgi:hypothetical protein